MRVRWLVPGFLVLASVGHAQALQRAAWLAGCWELRTASRSTIEMWMPPTGDLMLGASRTVTNGVVREFEQLQLRAVGDTLVYRAMPSGQSPTDFRSTRITSDTITFENPQHDFPQRIRYWRRGTDSLIARVEGPGPNNTTRGFSLPMRRVDCTQPIAAPIGPPPDTAVIGGKVSPDGSSMLVVRGVGSNWDLFHESPGRRAQLTDHSAVDYQPSWSPDGTALVFASARDGHQEIYLQRLGGSSPQRLTHGKAHNSEPDWSPDGRQVVFRSEQDSGGAQVHVMNTDGTERRALTSGTGGYSSPRWSPDGRRIATSRMHNGHLEVFVMQADGSGLTQLTTTAQGHSGFAVWSPDGRELAFWSTRDGNDEVYIMQADGSNLRNVSNSPSRDNVMDWTRDGWLVFRSNRDRPLNELYRMRPDGSSLTRLTTTPTTNR